MADNNYSLISSTQLAKICGVSQGTVDRALHNRTGINVLTKQKILDAAKKYGYIPNVTDNLLSGHRSQLYGIVLFNLYNDYFSDFIMNFEVLCKKIGYNSVVMFSHNDLKTEIGCLNQLVHLGVDGIILCPVGEGKEYSSYLKSLKTPIVTIGNRVEDIPFVGINDKKAMKEITVNALESSYSSFVYYAPVLKRRGKENIYAQQMRLEGFLSEIKGKNVFYEVVTDENELLETICDSKKKCAVICPSDVYAIRAFSAITGNRIKDTDIYGFDKSNLLLNGKFNIKYIEYDKTLLAEKLYNSLTACDKTLCKYIPFKIISF